MSVTFAIRSQKPDYEHGDNWLNLANANARDLLDWLGFHAEELWGEIPAALVAHRCRERLRLIAGNIDPARPEKDLSRPWGRRVIQCARAEGYLHDRCEALLVLAEQAGDHGVIVYG